MSLNAPSDWPHESGRSAPPSAGSSLPATSNEARGHALSVLRRRADLRGPAIGERALADILLVVSELFTNALRHGGGVTRFDVSVQTQVVRVTVGDRSTDLPQQRKGPRSLAGAGGEGGFGWPLVRELAIDITLVLERSGGKRITVTLPLTD